jgi:mono/diheme cytochrome c family protein
VSLPGIRFATLAVLALLTGCREDHETKAAKLLGVKVSDTDRVAAANLFAERCAQCHGANGAGDGPAAKALQPQPRNFHDPGWQSSVTDEQITKIIRFGGPAIGKSPVMPGNPDLVERGAVVASLTARLRSFGD